MGAEKAMNPTSFVIVAALVSSTTATAQSIEFVFDSSSSSGNERKLKYRRKRFVTF